MAVGIEMKGRYWPKLCTSIHGRFYVHFSNIRYAEPSLQIKKSVKSILLKKQKKKESKKKQLE